MSVKSSRRQKELITLAFGLSCRIVDIILSETEGAASFCRGIEDTKRKITKIYQGLKEFESGMGDRIILLP